MLNACYVHSPKMAGAVWKLLAIVILMGPANAQRGSLDLDTQKKVGDFLKEAKVGIN